MDDYTEIRDQEDYEDNSSAQYEREREDWANSNISGYWY